MEVDVAQYKEAIEGVLSQMDPDNVVTMVDSYGLLQLAKALVLASTGHDSTTYELVGVSASRLGRRGVARIYMANASFVGRSGPGVIEKYMTKLEAYSPEGDTGKSCLVCPETYRLTCLGLSDLSTTMLDNVWSSARGYLAFVHEVLGDPEEAPPDELYEALVEPSYIAAYAYCQKHDLFVQNGEDEEPSGPMDSLTMLLLNAMMPQVD